jgi:hypothetical protein
MVSKSDSWSIGWWFELNGGYNFLFFFVISNIKYELNVKYVTFIK